MVRFEAPVVPVLAAEETRERFAAWQAQVYG
jgi:hypothetical protein